MMFTDTVLIHTPPLSPHAEYLYKINEISIFFFKSNGNIHFTCKRSSLEIKAFVFVFATGAPFKTKQIPPT